MRKLHTSVRCLLVGMAVSVAGNLASSARADLVIYQDTFDRNGVALNGAAPDIRPGAETWVADPSFQSIVSGSVSYLNGAGPNNGYGRNAFLAFTPQADRVYTLTVTLNPTLDLNNVDWLSFGFTDVMDLTAPFSIVGPNSPPA